MCIFISTEFKKKKDCRALCPLMRPDSRHTVQLKALLWEMNETSVVWVFVWEVSDVWFQNYGLKYLWVDITELLFLSFLSSENNLFSSKNKDGILLCCYHVGEEICLEEVGTLWFSSGMWIVRLIFLFVPCNLSSKLWRLDSMNDIASHLIF